jgi:cell division protein FtsB
MELGSMTINEIWCKIYPVLIAIVFLASFYKTVLKKLLGKLFNIKFQTSGTKAVDDLENKTNEKFEQMTLTNKAIFEELKKLNHRFDEAEIKRNEAREETQERNSLILKGVLASLKVHRENGANGTVTPALIEIEKYVIDKASK